MGGHIWRGYGRTRFAVFACLLLAAPRLACAGDTTACAEAGLAAEQRQSLPPGLLLAIGRVESGRIDPASGRAQPWPWTIDVGGAGQHFASLGPALTTVQGLQARGVTSIDVGCFQINLAAHPQAFARLDQAFDPGANADYAGRFLLSLKQRLGDWGSAIAAYHSATPELGSAYRNLVMAAWGRAPDRATVAPDHGGPTIPLPPGVRTIAWVPPPPGIHVWLPGGSEAANVISLPGSPRLPTVRTPQHQP